MTLQAKLKPVPGQVSQSLARRPVLVVVVLVVVDVAQDEEGWEVVGGNEVCVPEGSMYFTAIPVP